MNGLQVFAARGIAGALAVTALGLSGARADRIVLRGGGEIKGVVLPADPEHPDLVSVLTRTASRPLELTKKQILRVESQDDELRTYLIKRDAAAQTGEAQFELAEWCDQAGLTGPALVHYRAAVTLSPELEAAHKKLGHVYHNGRWMTIDERRQAQGLTLHKGKWVTPDEKEAMDAKSAFSTEQDAWFRQLKVLRKKLYSNDARQAQEAESQLSAIREPAAVAPMLKVFGGDDVPVRVRIAQIVAAIPGDDSREALLRLLLNEPDIDVRERVLHELSTLKDAETIPRLIHALSTKNPAVVGRAAWALAQLDAKTAVPKLIPVLIKSESKWVVDPSATSGGGIGATFGSVEGMRSVPGGVGGGAVSGGATGGVNAGFAGGASIPVITGPVVGPGAVAYGATSVPYGNFAGLNVGANPNRPNAQLVRNHYPNEEVLEALRSLTGVDFGYNTAAWRRWVATSFRPEADQAAPERRVPQP